MANAIHGVIRTDLMSGTDDCSQLRFVKYMGADDTAADIDNGCVVKLSGLAEGEREAFKGVVPAANTPLDDVVVCAGVEILYDERDKNLSDYYNVAGKVFRGYRLHKGGIFSVTEPVLDAAADIAVGNIVELQAANKMKVVASATTGSTKVGEVIAIEQAGRYTYIVIEIK